MAVTASDTQGFDSDGSFGLTEDIAEAASESDGCKSGIMGDGHLYCEGLPCHTQTVNERPSVTNPIPVSEFKWTDDFSYHRTLSCKNHPNIRLSTKNPYERSIFVRESTSGSIVDCQCKREDLTVIDDGLPNEPTVTVPYVGSEGTGFDSRELPVSILVTDYVNRLVDVLTDGTVGTPVLDSLSARTLIAEYEGWVTANREHGATPEAVARQLIELRRLGYVKSPS